MGCDILSKYYVFINNKWTEDNYLKEPSYKEDRNYNTFAILADVRNGWLGKKYIPLDTLRGYHPDIYIPSYFLESAQASSYLTLSEMKYYWDKHKDMIVENPFFTYPGTYESETLGDISSIIDDLEKIKKNHNVSSDKVMFVFGFNN